MKWISVKDSMPPDSSEVLITDGANISTANWFSGFTNGDPAEWCNQWTRITGRYIDEPTHWMPMDDFKTLLLGLLPNDRRVIMPRLGKYDE